jgi:hypothetical protein
MTETFQVRRGSADDIGTIIGLINEAASWLRTKETDQWASPWPSETARDERVLRGQRFGRTWLVEDDRQNAVATVTARRYGNHELWGPDLARRFKEIPAAPMLRRPERAGKPAARQQDCQAPSGYGLVAYHGAPPPARRTGRD